MERLNKNGDARGMHNKHPKGSTHFKSKGWILFKNDEEIGYFASVSEVAEQIGKNPTYLRQLTRGRYIDKNGQPIYKTAEGFHIKPAKTIEVRDK